MFFRLCQSAPQAVHMPCHGNGVLMRRAHGVISRRGSCFAAQDVFTPVQLIDLVEDGIKISCFSLRFLIMSSLELIEAGAPFGEIFGQLVECLSARESERVWPMRPI